MDKFISCVTPGPSQWFFNFGEAIIITWTHRVSMMDVPESPIASENIVIKIDGVLYQQVSSFSPGCWMNVALQEHGVVGSIYHLLWRYIVVQYYPSMSYATMNITFRAYCVGRTFFGRGDLGCFHSFDWHMSESRFRP